MANNDKEYDTFYAELDEKARDKQRRIDRAYDKAMITAAYATVDLRTPGQIVLKLDAISDLLRPLVSKEQRVMTRTACDRIYEEWYNKRVGKDQ